MTLTVDKEKGMVEGWLKSPTSVITMYFGPSRPMSQLLS